VASGQRRSVLFTIHCTLFTAFNPSRAIPPIGNWEVPCCFPHPAPKVVFDFRIESSTLMARHSMVERDFSEIFVSDKKWESEGRIWRGTGELPPCQSLPPSLTRRRMPLYS
jgi:hypothetical protein